MLDWLYANAGPIVRRRLVLDFAIPISNRESAKLLKSVLAAVEVRRWLDNLGGTAIHGSKDTDAENAMAKLVEYGLRAGTLEFDRKMLPYTELDNPAADAFLIAAGFASVQNLANRFHERLEKLLYTANQGNYNLYLSPQETVAVPKAWHGKRIYRPEFDVDSLPSCYDFYSLAHWPSTAALERRKIEDVVAYISHPSFQNTGGGYLWNRDRNTCHSAGRVWLACLNPERIILFLELASRFESARRSLWFKNALSNLERYRTEKGTYRFASELLKEKRNSYYIYQGAHMGLGENRRNRNWIEIESPFRMLNIQRLMNLSSD